MRGLTDNTLTTAVALLRRARSSASPLAPGSAAARRATGCTLAIATPNRMALLPDVPTVSASGLPGFDSSIWYGLVAPAKTPPQIVQFLNAEIAILHGPAIIERLSSQGTVHSGDAPAAFAAMIAVDIERYAKLVRVTSIRAE